MSEWLRDTTIKNLTFWHMFEPLRSKIVKCLKFSEKCLSGYVILQSKAWNFLEKIVWMCYIVTENDAFEMFENFAFVLLCRKLSHVQETGLFQNLQP